MNAPHGSLEPRDLLAALRALKAGDWSVSLREGPGVDAAAAQAFTDVVAQFRAIEASRRALEEKAEQIALASQYKTEFLASMSHELRTPLNSLLILAKLLADNARGTLSSKDVDYAKTIYAAGTDLLAIINDILDLAKIESGTSTLFYANETLEDIRESLRRNFSQLAESRGLAFAVELDATLPAQIETDGKRLRQILKNLLSNAFKFTERGAVTLRIESAHDGWTPGHKDLDAAATVIAFSVIDTGIGISGSSQQLIFNAFQQVDGSTSRRHGGAGLGLSISRELAHLMKGEIHVQSVPGEGSRFTLYLPLREAKVQSAPAVPAPRATTLPRREAIPATHADEARRSWPRPQDTEGGAAGAVPGEGLAGRTVLIIDDDIRNIFALTCALEELRMNVCSAESGPEGIALLQSRPGIDVVLVDIMMPTVDGYETMRRIRALDALRDVPLVAVTAKAMKGDREKCLEAGANDYAAKPVNVEQLAALLRRLLVNGKAASAPQAVDRAG